jgi:NADPH:quinone reductase-like Zn-dependent oxidoreductase
MKSWWMSVVEGKPQLALREVATPEPGPAELLVRVEAASLNRGEFIAGVGLHGNAAARPAGIDAAGVVIGMGSEVSGFAPGDRVMGRAIGGLSECARMHHAEALPIPATLDAAHAAAFPLVFNVTFDMLVARGGLRAGETLLVTGASSGVGVACVQLGHALGARVIGTSGSAAKLERLKPLGLDAGIRTRAPDFARQVRELTDGRGADLVIDTVGGSIFAECMRACAFEGRVAMVGYVDRTLEATIDVGLLHEQRLALFGVSNKLRTAAQRAETVRRVAAELLPLLADGRLVPVIDRIFPMAEVPAAVAHLESDTQIGKVILQGWT